MSRYFLDSNIVMYVLGGAHPLKAPSLKIFEKIRTGKMPVCTNTEVLQEILYHYYSLNRKPLAHRACELVEEIADPIFPVSIEDIRTARSLLDRHTLPVRDAIHAASMLNHRIRYILSADSHFDHFPDIRRVFPR